MKFLILFSVLFLFSCTTPSPRASSAEPQVIRALEQTPSTRKTYEASSKKFMIVTQGIATTAAAQKIYDLGGNIIDAAIAASFAISVERPQSTGLGGGGFMLYRQAKTGNIFAIDFRERAPLKATEKMFLDQKGEVVPQLSTLGSLSVGVPGLVAGLDVIHKKFGSLPFKTLVGPAISLAENGFQVYPYLEHAFDSEKKELALYPATRKIFLKPNGEIFRTGDLLVQKDLAKTLRLIADHGPDAFYHGAIAAALVKESSRLRGLITQADLSNYSVHWREPVRGTFKGYDVISFPPPSSGGTHVVEFLNILENSRLHDLGFGTTASVHLEASAMQQIFADRAKFMGDPDFSKDIPVKGLLSKAYAKSIWEKIDLAHAKSADKISAGPAPAYESTDTTNFTIMDSEGNVVVSTQTINDYFGSKVVVPGTGILLNNEMDDFSAKPGAQNLFGAVGGIPNSIQPQKTPLSSMSPTIVLKNASPVLALGAPGGTRIITCVAQTILNHLEFNFSLYNSIAAVRIHHQWKPDLLEIETPGLGQKTQDELQKLGYKIKMAPASCRVNGISRNGDTLTGVADPRDIGSAVGE